MAKKKITDLIEEITADFLAENGLELYNSEFVKEGRDWFLRVYIDKLPAAQIETVHADTAGLRSARQLQRQQKTHRRHQARNMFRRMTARRSAASSVQSLTDWTRSRRTIIWRYLHRAWTGNCCAKKILFVLRVSRST